MENHTKYGDSIYFHSEDALWVNLFIASELNWREKGLSLKQETSYPDADTMRFTFKTRKPLTLAVRLRYPAWATKGLSVWINDRPQSVNAKPGSFVELRRTWKTGDRISLKIPMSLRLEALPDNPHRVAILYGPTVLAGDLGSDEQTGVNHPDPHPRTDYRRQTAGGLDQDSGWRAFNV